MKTLIQLGRNRGEKLLVNDILCMNKVLSRKMSHMQSTDDRMAASPMQGP